MKKAILATVLLLNIQLVRSQCIENPTFETNNPPMFSTTGTAFSDGLVNNWSANTRDPSIFGWAAGGQGNPYAWMWSKSGTAESIRAIYPFEDGKTYQISFDIMTDDNDPNIYDNDVAFGASANIYSVDLGHNGQIPTTSSAWAEQIWSHYYVFGNGKWFSDFYGNNWIHKTITYYCHNTADAIVLFPYMQATPVTPLVQANMMIDNLVITGEPANHFHFQATNTSNGTSQTLFTQGCDIYLNGESCTFEDRYFINVRKRPIGGSNWTWIGSPGWVEGQLGVINLSAVYANLGITFNAGFEYDVQLATQNLPCMNWLEKWHSFTVQSGINIVADFYLRDLFSTAERTQFPDALCDLDVLMDATASQNYTQYYIAARKKLPTDVNYSWVGSLNWTAGQMTGPINLSALGLFGSQGLQSGYDYEITLALGNSSSGASACHGWIPRVQYFHVFPCNIKSADAEMNTSINGIQTTKTMLYPNPTNDKLTISSEQEIKSVTVIDQLGRIVLTANDEFLNVSELLPDVYFLMVEYSDGLMETFRFVKSK